MQKERTIDFWNDFHEKTGEKEWIVHPTSDLFHLICSQFPVPTARGEDITDNNGDGLLRVLEIGCGTSTMAREFWNYVQEYKTDCNFFIRATDVSQVCIDACWERDKDIMDSHYIFPSDHQLPVQGKCCGLQYATLNVMSQPTKEDCGTWDAILDKACLDTFLFRSRHRGQSKAYSGVIQTALDNIWSLLSDDGVYILMSPRTKLKAVRDYAGFASVERRIIDSEAKGSRISKPKYGSISKKHADDACYMYVCKKNCDYVIGETKAFKENLSTLPPDHSRCHSCGVIFTEFLGAENPEDRGVVFWSREWKNHCIHCKLPAPSLSKKGSSKENRATMDCTHPGEVETCRVSSRGGESGQYAHV